MEPAPSSSQELEPEHLDLNVLRKMEDEHLRLQRQCRAIQTDRNERCMGVHPTFRQHDNLLKVLKHEYMDLMQNLKIANKGAHKKADRKMKVMLKRQLLLRMNFEQKKEGGCIQMQQYDHLIKRNNKYILKLRAIANSRMGQLKERRIQSNQRLVSTENRLETAKLRFNTIQYENQLVREEIECMLKDRALFNQSWNKMMKALNTGKKFLLDLFESSTLAYDQRDEWVTKLKSVQQKGRVDQMLQLQEMRDLQKAYNHEMRLFNFLLKKGMIRINQKEEERVENQKLAEMQEKDEELAAHRQLLDDISNYAEQENVDRIIENFVRRESENFSIYCLLTDYCAENVVLEKDLSRIRQVLVDRSDWNDSQEETRQKKLARLRKVLEEQKMKTGELRSKIEEQDSIIKDALSKINEIFTMLECSSEPFQNLLGDKKPSRWLLDLPLRLITEKIKEYIETVYYCERVLHKRPDKKMTSSRLRKFTVRTTSPECWTALPITLRVPSDPCPACIEGRWLSRVSEEREEPFTKEQALAAIKELSSDPAFLRSDRIHNLVDCRVPRSRVLVAARNFGYNTSIL